MSTVAQVFPEFTQELIDLIKHSTHPQLATSIEELPIVARCQCDQSDCAHFYTAPRPHGAYGPGHFNVMLSPTRGFVVLDVVG